MIIQQIYTGCLAQGTYYIQSGNEAVVIDPLREVQPYIAKANAEGATIKFVLETHFHADFVSGHLDLARQTGAQIVYGPTADTNFKAHIATDGEEFKVGELTIRALHTPGHTMESVCYLLLDKDGKQLALFSGDTLFIGDVGRPDLAQKASELSQDELAGLLFDSLRNKIMPLDNDVIIYPAHGAGSACGKNMSSETTDTLGNQKKYNYALRQNMTRDEFIAEVTHGLLPPPSYFPENVKMNKEGYGSIDGVISRGTQALLPDEFEQAANATGALILDTRHAQTFAKAFIPNSVNIGINGSFAPWVGALISDMQQPILLVTDEGREEEAVTRLARVGYDHAMGYLKGGIAAWIAAGKDVDDILSVTPGDIPDGAQIIDVRKINEFETAHVIDTENIPLDYINDSMAKLNKHDTYYVTCAGGYRSMIFNSVLRARGYKNLVDIDGGFNAINQSGKFKIVQQDI